MNTVDNEQMIRKEAGPPPTPVAVDNQVIANLIAESHQLRAEIDNSTARLRALSIQWSLIIEEARGGKSEGINWSALVDEIVGLDRWRADELSRNASIGAFHRELMNFLDEYCGRLQAFVAANPHLDGKCRASLKQALVLNAERLDRASRMAHFLEDDIPF